MRHYQLVGEVVGGSAEERISTLFLGHGSAREQRGPSELPRLIPLVLHIRWLSASQFSAILYNYLGRSHSFSLSFASYHSFLLFFT